LACAVERRRFPVGASPTRQPLQPEASSYEGNEVAEAFRPITPSLGVTAEVTGVTNVEDDPFQTCRAINSSPPQSS
jgi:hypothetical protein